VPPEPPPVSKLGILLLSGEYERAHYAFMVATAAAAVGRQVVLFATNDGCHALADWSLLRGAGRTAVEQDGMVQTRGVAGITELREAAMELGVTLLACDSGLRLSGVLPQSLLPRTEVAGIPTFLSSVGVGQIVTL